MRRRIFTAGVGAAAIAASIALAGPANAAEGDAQLSVLHGVPNLTVDVWVNGNRTLDDFTPGSLAGPLALPAGAYQIAITAADAPDASAAVIGPVSVNLAANGNYTAVANLDAAGKPTANLFTNDMSQIPAGKGKLTVRHTAAAPAVDVLAAGSPVITNLSNPNEQTLTLDPGTISAAVAATGTTAPVIGPADVTVKEGTHTIVYAWGSLTDKNLQLAVQTIDGMHSAPGSVPGARDGSADAAPAPATLALGFGAAALVLLLGGLGVARTAAARNREQ
ncbi:lipoprotein [Arthrobacter sp. NtRootA9]|nr:lipoprotein [Arthrobacter sp. NtRootA9]